MGNPREIELKFVCDSSELRKIADWPRLKGGSTGGPTDLVSVYFDTPKLRLRGAGYVLRVRRERDGYVQTAKADGDGLVEREEWEARIGGAGPDRDAIDRTPLAKVAGKKKLEAKFRVSVARTAYDVQQGASRIEVVLDEGRIAKPHVERKSDSVPVSEVELELKSGSTSDLFDLARELSRHVPLRLGVKSKAQRGFDLIGGGTPHVQKAEPVALSKEMTAGDAFRTIAHACLRHMRINEDILLDHRNPEALHQTRVAIRRLRSALSLFKDIVADERVEGVKADLKRLSAPLGTARNLDVFLTDTFPKQRAERLDGAEMLTVEKHLEARRTAAYAEVAQRLRSEEWQRFVVKLVAWISAGPWTAGEGHPNRDKAARKVAAKILDQRYRQVAKRGRDIEGLSPEDRHQVRIAAKKLRYGSEFFASLFDGKKRAERRSDFLATLSDLQDDLGALNDAATAHEVLAEVVDLPGEARSAFAAGMAAGDLDAGSAEHLASAASRHDELRGMKPFWN